MATLSFDAVGVGKSPLIFARVSVDDAFGGKLLIEEGSGSIKVVPEQDTFVLLSMGLVGLIV